MLSLTTSAMDKSLVFMGPPLFVYIEIYIHADEILLLGIRECRCSEITGLSFRDLQIPALVPLPPDVGGLFVAEPSGRMSVPHEILLSNRTCWVDVITRAGNSVATTVAESKSAVVWLMKQNTIDKWSRAWIINHVPLVMVWG
jgi:hypothetical protein